MGEESRLVVFEILPKGELVCVEMKRWVKKDARNLLLAGSRRRNGSGYRTNICQPSVGLQSVDSLP